MFERALCVQGCQCYHLQGAVQQMCTTTSKTAVSFSGSHGRVYNKLLLAIVGMCSISFSYICDTRKAAVGVFPFEASLAG